MQRRSPYGILGGAFRLFRCDPTRLPLKPPGVALTSGVPRLAQPPYTCPSSPSALISVFVVLGSAALLLDPHPAVCPVAIGTPAHPDHHGLALPRADPMLGVELLQATAET